jgi:hypothetical protein
LAQAVVSVQEGGVYAVARPQKIFLAPDDLNQQREGAMPERRNHCASLTS